MIANCKSGLFNDIRVRKGGEDGVKRGRRGDRERERATEREKW